MSSSLPRKTYARIPVNIKLPNLIEVQLDSFERLKREGLGDLFHPAEMTTSDAQARFLVPIPDRVADVRRPTDRQAGVETDLAFVGHVGIIMGDADKEFGRVLEIVRVGVFEEFIPEAQKRSLAREQVLVPVVANENEMSGRCLLDGHGLSSHIEAQGERSLFGEAGEGAAPHCVRHGLAIRAEHTAEFGWIDVESTGECAGERLVGLETRFQCDLEDSVGTDFEARDGTLDAQAAQILLRGFARDVLEDAMEVVRREAGDSRQLGERHRLIEMLFDMDEHWEHALLVPTGRRCSNGAQHPLNIQISEVACSTFLANQPRPSAT